MITDPEPIVAEENFPAFSDIPEQQLSEWMSIDDNVQTAYRPTEDEICAQILKENQFDSDNSDNEEEIIYIIYISGNLQVFKHIAKNCVAFGGKFRCSF